MQVPAELLQQPRSAQQQQAKYTPTKYNDRVTKSARAGQAKVKVKGAKQLGLGAQQHAGLDARRSKASQLRVSTGAGASARGSYGSSGGMGQSLGSNSRARRTRPRRRAHSFNDVQRLSTY